MIQRWSVSRSAMAALWRTAHPQADLDGDLSCAVCGGPSAGHYHSARIMADTFVRYDVFRRPTEPTVCDACAWYLDGSGKQTGEPHVPFQKMSYVIVGNSFHGIEREQVRSLLRRFFPGPPFPVYLILSRQKKKHLALLAQPWMPGSILTVQFEEQTIRLPRTEFESIRRSIRLLLDAGIGKRTIASGALAAKALKDRQDIGQLLTWMHALDPWRPSSALDFALWIAHTPDS